jgi:4-hydroxy-tetrahydrodipicolinate reductase
MGKYRVIQWGVGYTGESSLRYVVGNHKLELVGIKCFTEAKEGRTAFELCGHGPTDGVRATRNVDQLLALDADCVLFMPRDLLMDPSVPDSLAETWMVDLIAILESGANVVTPICTGTHWRQLANPQAFLDRINVACGKGNSTVTFTGFDPGFSTDYLPYTLAGVVGEVAKIRTWEVLDYSDYPALETLTQLGFGVDPSTTPPGATDIIRNTWGGAMYLLGDSMGVHLDRIEVDAEIFIATEPYTSPKGFFVDTGTVGGYWFKLSGHVGDKELFVINHVTRMGAQMAPEWPTMGTDGGYRIEIDSYPPLTAELPMALPGGTGSAFADVMVMTAGRCVNTVEAVVRADQGYKTYLELPPVGGRYTMNV